MKIIVTLIAMLSWSLAPIAEAATEQQNKMVTCNKEATGKKGDERKAFMKECLSKKPAAAEIAATPATAEKTATAEKAAPTAPAAESPSAGSQQNKMAACNKEATGKKGDERKAFMKECLKAK